MSSRHLDALHTHLPPCKAIPQSTGDCAPTGTRAGAYTQAKSGTAPRPAAAHKSASHPMPVRPVHAHSHLAQRTREHARCPAALLPRCPNAPLPRCPAASPSAVLPCCPPAPLPCCPVPIDGSKALTDLAVALSRQKPKTRRRQPLAARNRPAVDEGVTSVVVG